MVFHPSEIPQELVSHFNERRGSLRHHPSPALSVWWISLGITIVRSRPGCPQDNGGHERMHRDMSADVEAFPQRDHRSEQRAVDRWRQQFNQVRPHEALGGKTPAEVYRSAPRHSLVIPRWQYPHGWMVRRPAAPNGVISFSGELLVVGKAFIGHAIGIEPIDDRNGRFWPGISNSGRFNCPHHAPSSIRPVFVSSRE